MKRLRAGFPRFGLLSLLVIVGGTQAAVAQPWFTRNIGCAGTHWISLPRDTDLLTAEDLCAAIPGALTVTQRFPSATAAYTFDCALLTCTSTAAVPEPGCVGSACFCTNDGEGYEVVTSMAGALVVNGSDTCGPITLPAGGVDYLISPPYFDSLHTAADLAAYIGLPSTGLQRGTITARKPCTGVFTTCSAGTAPCQSLLLNPGEAYQVRYLATTGATFDNPTACDPPPPPTVDTCPIPDMVFTDDSSLSWGAPARCPLAALYDLMKGDIDCLGGGCAAPLADPCPTCMTLEDNDVDTVGTDLDIPAEGMGFWYLARVEGGTLNTNGSHQCFDRDVYLSFGCP